MANPLFPAESGQEREGERGVRGGEKVETRLKRTILQSAEWQLLQEREREREKGRGERECEVVYEIEHAKTYYVQADAIHKTQLFQILQIQCLDLGLLETLVAAPHALSPFLRSGSVKRGIHLIHHQSWPTLPPSLSPSLSLPSKALPLETGKGLSSADFNTL